MKLLTGPEKIFVTQVAPHAGAWIETADPPKNITSMMVAPHAGAWIETFRSGDCLRTGRSRPPRGGVD